MRQRRVRNLEEKLNEMDQYRVLEWDKMKNHWRTGPEQSLYLEIGCGKGGFITEQAKRHPEWDLVAIEGNDSVAYQAMEKSQALELGNIRFIQYYVWDVREIFGRDELDGIFLNFSDPWPKARHAKRRLTHRRRLGQYQEVIKEDGYLEFKTDNDGLFDFSLEEVEATPGMEIEFCTRDLHRDIPLEEIVQTEYERKFSERGKNINYMRVRIVKG